MSQQILRLSPGDRVPEREPACYPEPSGVVRLRWQLGPSLYAEIEEHRVKDGVVQAAPKPPVRGKRVWPADPSRHDLVTAIDCGLRRKGITERFGITNGHLTRLLADYGLALPVGPRRVAKPVSVAAAPATRSVLITDRTPLDRLLDHEAQRHRERHAWRGLVILEWCARQQPVRDPIGHTLGDKWRHHALCRGLSPALFKHAHDARPTWAFEVARTVCAACPVRDVCPHREVQVAVREPAA